MVFLSDFVIILSYLTILRRGISVGHRLDKFLDCFNEILVVLASQLEILSPLFKKSPVFLVDHDMDSIDKLRSDIGGGYRCLIPLVESCL